MKKNIENLKTSEENKLLISKIIDNVNFLSSKSDEYFENVKTIISNDIEKAFSVNEDLLKVLKTNDDEIEEIKNESFQIRKEHQVDFTIEVQLPITQEIKQSTLITSTESQKDLLISSDEKIDSLSKIVKYLNNKSKRNKKIMNNEIANLESKINNSQMLNIDPMKEDIYLIKKFMNEKDLKTNAKWYWIVLCSIIFISLIMLGVLIWMN